MEENKTMHCINCSVQNCVHHTSQDRCDAGEIKVGNEQATKSGDTCCDTFKSREHC